MSASNAVTSLLARPLKKAIQTLVSTSTLKARAPGATERDRPARRET
jgi:hypothetical protein